MVVRRSLIVCTALAFAAGATVAQTRDLPPNTINCAAFAKLPNGDWHVGARTSFVFGRTKQVMENQTIKPRLFFLSAFDFYEVLQRKCAN